jgi:hypothetical protein
MKLLSKKKSNCEGAVPAQARIHPGNARTVEVAQGMVRVVRAGAS